MSTHQRPDLEAQMFFFKNQCLKSVIIFLYVTYVVFLFGAKTLVFLRFCRSKLFVSFLYYCSQVRHIYVPHMHRTCPKDLRNLPESFQTGSCYLISLTVSQNVSYLSPCCVILRNTALPVCMLILQLFSLKSVVIWHPN